MRKTSKLGLTSAGTQEVSEQLMEVQALLELVFKAQDFGEVEGMGLGNMDAMT